MLCLTSGSLAHSQHRRGVAQRPRALRGAAPLRGFASRARDARQAKRLYGLEVNDALPQTIEAPLQLSEALLVYIGIPMGVIIASIYKRRDEFRKELNNPDVLGGRTRRWLRNS